ncbi:hypothetical protein [Bacillus cereus]|uniref:hypothetical protein n=1 Tax=Bacillus cereus TaxID=1396 RepID=UPI000B2737FE|nr:hypothetical protein [Bacillus cereus]
MKKWIIAIIYCSLLTTFSYLSIKTVLLSATTSTSFLCWNVRINLWHLAIRIWNTKIYFVCHGG